VIEVIDYGGGNIGSVTRCLERLEVPYSTSPPTGNHAMILPGVGAFGAVMNHLNQNGLAGRIKALVQEGVPYLGICVGLQVLFDTSEESPEAPGLGLVPGSVVKFQAKKVPQIGWNAVTSANSHYPSGYVYFVNSYYPKPADPDVTLYEADYNGPFCAAIQQQNITAFQFHPEKSGVFGHDLIKRWLLEAAV
jgi:glutamine amidotransferase